MTTQEISEKVKELIQPYTAGFEITDNSELEADLGMDSLDMIETICNLERDFDIVITDDEAQKIKTFGQLTAMTERLVNDKTGTGSRLKN